MPGYDRRRERRIVNREMERFRLFRFQSLEFFLLTQLARDFTERRLHTLAVRIDRRGRVSLRGGAAIIFRGAFVLARFDFGLIFRREDLLSVEIFFRINVLGSFLPFLFAGAFLARGIGDTLILLGGILRLPLRIRSRRAAE